MEEPIHGRKVQLTDDWGDRRRVLSELLLLGGLETGHYNIDKI